MARITVQNPNTGRDDASIDAGYYEAVRSAILEAIADAGEVAFGDLRDQVEARTDPALWDGSSVGWYTTTVKLDLEARGLITRHGSPQILRLTEAGRSALGRPDVPTR